MAIGTHRRPVEQWSALGLAGLVTGLALLDGTVGAGAFVSSPITLVLAASCGALLGAWTPNRVAGAGVLVTAGALTYANQRHFPHEYPAADDLAFFLIAIGAPALLGAIVIGRIRQVRELDDVRRRLAARRREDIAAARLAEQQRIEMAVQHRLVERLGAITLRAEGATAEGGQAVQEALTEIEETSRAGLAELRHALGVLHEEPQAQVVEEPTWGEDGRSPRAEPPPRRGDILLAAGLGAAMAVESVVSSASRGPGWANVVFAFAVTAPLALRRRHPLPAVTALMALAAAYTAVLTPLPAMVTSIASVLVVAYSVGRFTRGRWRLVGTALMWLGYVLLGAVSPAGAQDPEGLLPTLLWSALAVGAGVISAAWHERAEQMRDLVAEMERLRDADVTLAVARQRQRVARDLHDTVAHALSVVCLNAGAAQTPGASPAGALTSIADAARAGMTELRRGLHALEPAEGMDAPSVRLMANRLGIDLTLVVPQPDEVTAADTALLLRVLRESLVNVARHAPGAQVVATVSVDEAAVRMEIVDSGAAIEQSGTPRGGAGAELGAGVGLSGLAALVRERGGTLDFGSLSSGFRVAASFPRDGEAKRRQVVPAVAVPARPPR